MNRAWRELELRCDLPSGAIQTHLPFDGGCLAWTGQNSVSLPHWRLLVHGEMSVGPGATRDSLIRGIVAPGVIPDTIDGDGIFTLIAWQDTGELELLTDHSGERALYITERDGCICFSSNPAHLARACEAPLDRETSWYFLQTGGTPPAGSLFEGIIPLPPSSRTSLRWTGSGTPSLHQSIYVDKEAFAARLGGQDAADALEVWLRRTVRHDLGQEGTKVVDLSSGADSRVLAAYLDAEASAPLDYVTSLGEYEGASSLLPYLHHAGQHLDLDRLEAELPVEGVEKLLDSSLLAGGARDLAQAVYARLRIERLFRDYTFRFTGIGVENIRDWQWFQDFGTVLLGRQPGIDRFLQRYVHFQAPRTLFHAPYRDTFDVLKTRAERFLESFPWLEGFDRIDQLYLAATTRGRVEPQLMQADQLGATRTLVPFNRHHFITLARQVKARNRLFFQLPRELLYRANPALCSIPTNHGNTLRPLRGTHLVPEALSLAGYYGGRLLKKTFRRVTVARRGMAMNRSVADSLQPVRERIEQAIRDDLSDGLHPAVERIAKEKSVRERVGEWGRAGVLPGPDVLALTRIATLNRVAAFVDGDVQHG